MWVVTAHPNPVRLPEDSEDAPGRRLLHHPYVSGSSTHSALAGDGREEGRAVKVATSRGTVGPGTVAVAHRPSHFSGRPRVWRGSHSGCTRIPPNMRSTMVSGSPTVYASRADPELREPRRLQPQVGPDSSGETRAPDCRQHRSWVEDNHSGRAILRLGIRLLICLDNPRGDLRS